MKRVLSWIVLLLISCLISLLSSFVGMIRSYIFSFINELSTFLRVLIYVFGGTTFFSLLLLPVHYGSLLAISASEAIKKLKKRYAICCFFCPDAYNKCNLYNHRIYKKHFLYKRCNNVHILRYVDNIGARNSI